MSKPLRFTLHWNCSQTFNEMSASFVDLLDSLEEGKTNYWILMTPMLPPAIIAWVYWLFWLCCVVEITLLNRSKRVLLSEWTVGNELVFVLTFVSTNNTAVETAEQFILLYTSYVCDFSGLINFSQKLLKLEGNIYIVRCFLHVVFMLLTHGEFFDAFHWKKFRLKTVCLFQRLIIGQFIRKSSFLDNLFACC